jgi:hypothetical protein
MESDDKMPCDTDYAEATLGNDDSVVTRVERSYSWAQKSGDGFSANQVFMHEANVFQRDLSKGTG